jgi:protein-S-isoprenylcysteine O-methyltransferase Ste14
MKRNNILPPTYLMISIFVMVLLNILLPWTRIIPAPWNLMGATLLILGILINVITDNAFRLAGTTVKPFEKSTLLVTSGLYRFTRNPMYLGFVSVLTGLAILLGSVTPFLIIPLFIILIDRRFITAEERMLAARFGGTWQEYETRTRRWV